MADMGYSAALRWVIENDDTEWLRSGIFDRGTETGSVDATITLLSLIYRKNRNRVMTDLYKMKIRMELLK